MNRLMALTPQIKWSDFIWVFFTFILMWFSLAGWAFVSPVGASPDEDFHQTMIYCAATNNDPSHCSPEGVRKGSCFSMNPAVSASCSKDAELKMPAATRTDWSTVLPLYHKTFSWVVGEDLGTTTIRVRLLNVTLAVVAAFMSIGLSIPSLRRPVAISWLVTSVPVGNYFIASINSSSWAIISVASIWGPLLSILMAPGTSQSAKFTQSGKTLQRVAFVVFCMIIGLGSRNETFVWILLEFAAVIIYWACGYNLFKTKIKYLVASVLFIGVGFYCFSDLLTQPLLKAGLQSHMSIYRALYNYVVYPEWRTLQLTINSLLGSFALSGVPGGELGTHDVPTTAIASFFVTIGLAGSALLGLQYLNLAKVIGLAFITSSLFFISTFLWSLASWDIYQPRYFLPIIYVILGFALLPTVGQMTFNRAQWGAVFMSAALANCIMMLSTELRFLFGSVYQVTRYPLNLEAPEINPTRLVNIELPGWWLASDWASPLGLWLSASLAYALAVSLTWRWLVSERELSNHAALHRAKQKHSLRK